MDKVDTQISQPEYDPAKLLDLLLEKLVLKNDAALSHVLEVAPPVISKIRHRRLPVGASILIRMHDISNLSVAELRNVLGDRRKKYRHRTMKNAPKSSPNNYG